MKRVAIVIDELSVGGIPKACVDFANQLNEQCNVVLLMKRDNGPMMAGLSKEILVKLIKMPTARAVIKNLRQKKKYVKLIKYILCYTFGTRISKRWIKVNELTAKVYGTYEEDSYDCVIAYHGMSISQLLIALYGVKGEKKIAWIHGDHPFEGIHKKDVNSVYKKFDKIFCVSPSMCTRFLRDFPNLQDIVDSYKNLLLPDRITRLAQASISETINYEDINIVTVGRISKEKGQEMIPYIVAKLKSVCPKVHWYIVGNGEDSERIKDLCDRCGVQDSISFLGEKSNPYPYMKMCDIYVQPSYTEGYCLTVCEAAILRKPIVLTEIAASEILEDGKTAIVVQSSVEALTEGILRLIRYPETRDTIKKNLGKLDLSNSQEIIKLIQFIR